MTINFYGVADSKIKNITYFLNRADVNYHIDGAMYDNSSVLRIPDFKAPMMIATHSDDKISIYNYASGTGIDIDASDFERVVII